MKYISTNQLDRFDIRDCCWELASWTDRDVAVRVTNPAILAGEYAGEQIETALVTFQGFRLEWAKLLDVGSEISLSLRGAMELLEREPMFVFSYWTDGSSCEICGLGDPDVLAMVFDFESVTVEWDAFTEKPVGELIKR